MNRALIKALAAAILGIAVSPVLAETLAKIGVDYWGIQKPEVQTRYMPNYSTPKPRKSTAAWAAVASSGYLTSEVQYNVQAQYHEVDGFYVSRAYLDWKPFEETGFRLGVLPYRMSNCRQYGDNNVWIREPDPFCRFSGLNEISQGSFGVQAYQTSSVKDWVVDYSLGVFAPKVDGQDTKLGPYKKVGETLSHSKVVASVSGVHLPSGTQVKAGVSGTEMIQSDDRPVSDPYTRDLAYKSWFVAVNWSLTPTWSAAVSGSGTIGDQRNPVSPASFNGRSLSAETSYRATPRDRLSLGINRYTNITTYPGVTNKQSVDVPAWMIAWRHSFEGGMQVKLQYMEGSDDYITTKKVQTFTKNRALGAQLSYSF